MKRVLAAIVISGLALSGSGSLLSLDDIDSRRDPSDLNLYQFVRIRYNGYVNFWNLRRGEPPWAHDYPRGERNLLKILLEVTSVETTTESHLILDLNDPAIMNYPVIYVSEPGYWNVTDEEADNLREYLKRGGFVIFDDFRGFDEMANLKTAMRKVLPERTFQRLTLQHPVFHCFYDIDTLDMIPPYRLRGQGHPEFHGIVDEQGRLQVIANYNNDIGDYWEWSDDPLTPIPLSNEAFKFGINYIIYGMTH